jgi:hypothetical protein
MSSIDRRGFFARAGRRRNLALLDPAVSLAQPMLRHIDSLGHFGSHALVRSSRTTTAIVPGIRDH